MTRLNVGDWVEFPYYCDEKRRSQRVRGVVDSVKGRYANIRGIDWSLYVSQPIVNLKPYPNTPERTQEITRALIDIALDVKDRQWFEELTRELKRIQEVEG
ncbi:IDEAL domain-containing protein [Bacillus sp. SB47]|uniref:IDEAL domain-containing protein n=1 Tax=Bacillus sp. SB47 TaxID=1071079 RepID=UPI00047DB771|nr:IDEAL domain-containing protein [Bacillus sp. SB47]